VGSAPAPRLANAVLAEYQAAGLDYGPPAAPIETLDELGRVVGMSPAVLAAIRPHLTLYGPPQPNAATADPIVAAALAAASRAEIAPSPLQPPPDVLTTRIVAAAVRSEQRKFDPLRDCPFWRRAAQWLPSARLGQPLLIPIGCSPEIPC
jgi:hypothetical protein